MSEEVTCRFVGARNPQTCTSTGGHSCTGLGSCKVTVSGPRGAKLTWKSSCGGYAYTTLDGQDEDAPFKCP